ncbi:hypothetical protein LSAT2_020710 [Lamellibrachia satsuma]|nr:hypothetical protein LSAT2_020710 [Lamellibrachia satsuma]
MTAAAAPIATNVTALASSLPPLAVGSRASPPSWVERMQADDTSPNKRSVAMWGANHPTKHLITKTQWTLVVTDNGTVMGVRSREDKPKFAMTCMSSIQGPLTISGLSLLMCWRGEIGPSQKRVRPRDTGPIV